MSALAVDSFKAKKNDNGRLVSSIPTVMANVASHPALAPLLTPQQVSSSVSCDSLSKDGSKFYFALVSQVQNGSLTYSFNVVIAAACAASASNSKWAQMTTAVAVEQGGNANMLDVAFDLVKLSYRVGSPPDAVTLNPLLRSV